MYNNRQLLANASAPAIILSTSILKMVGGLVRAKSEMVAC